jgi:hypothetical protein
VVMGLAADSCCCCCCWWWWSAAAGVTAGLLLELRVLSVLRVLPVLSVLPVLPQSSSSAIICLGPAAPISMSVGTGL